MCAEMFEHVKDSLKPQVLHAALSLTVDGHPQVLQEDTRFVIIVTIISAAAPRLWNELPVNIRASVTLPMFRKCLETYLFIRHFN